MKVLIFGLGYVGGRLADDLTAAGHVVTGVRRQLGDTAGAAHEIRAADILNPADLAGLGNDWDAVVYCVSSSRGGVDAFRDVFETGTQNLVEWLGKKPPARLFFTSSTSVYGQTDGGLVDESSPAAPDSETGRILVAAEQRLLAAAADWRTRATMLRVAGIYGPDRGHLFLKFLRDEAAITGDPERFLNQVHRDDVSGVIRQLLERPELPSILNVADDEPGTQTAFYRFLADRLGKPLPPVGEAPARRKRAVTNKRVANNRLRGELNLTLEFPTYREGYLAEMRRLGLSPKP